VLTRMMQPQSKGTARDCQDSNVNKLQNGIGTQNTCKHKFQHEMTGQGRQYLTFGTFKTLKTLRTANI
jgi:hypothetical protein